MSIKFHKNGRRTNDEKTLFTQLRDFLKSNSISDYDGKVFHTQDEMKAALNDAKIKSVSGKSNTQIKEEQQTKEVIKETIQTETKMSETTDIPESFGNFDKPQSSEPKEDWSPLTSSDAIERSYTKEDNKQDFEIPEFTFDKEETASVNDVLSGNAENKEETSSEPSFKEKHDEFKESARNPYMKEMSQSDKLKSAEQLADTILGGYEFLHQFAEKAASFPEEKLAAAIQDGELDPSVSIPISETTSVTAVEYFQEHNETVKEVMSYDKEFGEEVKPVLTRVLAKRDWGMTDEQWLIYKFGKDIAMKGAAVVALRKTSNQILSAFIQQSTNVAMQNRQHEPAKSPDSITRPQKKETPPTKDVDVDNIEDVESEFEETVES